MVLVFRSANGGEDTRTFRGRGEGEADVGAVAEQPLDMVHEAPLCRSREATPGIGVLLVPAPGVGRSIPLCLGYGSKTHGVKP